MPTTGIWYWCSDQVIVQRVLAAKNEGHAKTGCIMAAFIKISVMFIFVMPGTIAGYLYPEEIARDSNIAFPLLVKELMPPVLKGIMISAMLAAAMSSLASVFNSASTIFTMDIYKRIRKNSGQRELVLVGKLATTILVGISLAWIPFIQSISDQLYIYINSVSSYTAPPITAMFLLGVLWRGTTSVAAMISLGTGFIIGALRFVMEIIFKGRSNGNAFLYVFADLNYLHFSILLFWITVIQLVVFSLLTPKQWRNEHVDKYTINYKKFFKRGCGWMIPKRYRRMQEEEVENKPENSVELDSKPETSSEHHSPVISNDDTQHSVDEISSHDTTQLHNVAIEVTEEQKDEEQILKEFKKKIRQSTGWHQYSWLLVPVLCSAMAVLIVIFR
jgi:hypothetical protein